MKDLARLLQLLNTLVIEQLQGSLAPAGASLDGTLSLAGVQLKTLDAEGLTFDELRLGLQDLSLPSPEDRSLAATLRVDRMVLRIDPAFFQRASEFARERLVAKVSQLLDRVVLNRLRVRLEVAADKTIALEVALDRVQVWHGAELAKQVDDLRLRLENFVPGPDKKAALAASRLFLYSLQVRVGESFLNKTPEVVREKIPKKIEAVELELNGDVLKVKPTVRLGPLPLSLSVQLKFATQDNKFGISFQKILGMPLGKVLAMVADGLGSWLPDGIESDSRTIWVSPWKKIPIPITCRAERFTIENNQIVLEFVPPAGAPALRLEAPPEPAETRPLVSNPTSVVGYLPPLP